MQIHIYARKIARNKHSEILKMGQNTNGPSNFASSSCLMSKSECLLLHVIYISYLHVIYTCMILHIVVRGGGLGSSTIFKKFNEPYAPS